MSDYLAAARARCAQPMGDGRFCGTPTDCPVVSNCCGALIFTRCPSHGGETEARDLLRKHAELRHQGKMGLWDGAPQEKP